MMKNYEFKQAIRVGRASFPLGIRQVPADIEKHPHFQKFLKAGSVRVAGASQIDKKLSDLPVLPPPSSAAAKRSHDMAEAVESGPVVPPESEIGGDAAPVSEPHHEEKKKGKGK